MWKTFLIQGWRNLRRNSRRTAFTVAVISVGLVLMIYAYGLVEGFVPQMVEGSARTLHGHILIHKRGYFREKSLTQAIADPKRVEQVLAQEPRVEGWSKRLLARGLMGSTEGVQGVRILGADPKADGKLIHLYHKIRKGRAPRPTSKNERASDQVVEVLLGHKIATKLKVDVGSKVVLKLGRFGGGATDEPMRVSGIFQTGSPGFDSFYVVIHRAEMARMLNAKDQIHQYAIRVQKLEQVEPVVAALKASLDAGEALEVLSWEQFAPEVKALTRMSGATIVLTLLLIFPILLLGCLNTMLMSAHERTREIGIMKAVGTTRSQIVQLFFWEGVFLSLVGAAIGIVLGVALTLYTESVGGISLKPFMRDDVKMMVSGIALDPVMWIRFTLLGVVWPTLTVFVSTVLASLYPAWKASRLEPTRAIQFH